MDCRCRPLTARHHSHPCFLDMPTHRTASAVRVFSAYALQNRPMLINRILQIHVRIHASQMPPDLDGMAHIELQSLYCLQQARICRGAGDGFMKTIVVRMRGFTTAVALANASTVAAMRRMSSPVRRMAASAAASGSISKRSSTPCRMWLMSVTWVGSDKGWLKADG